MAYKVLMFHENTEMLPSGDSFDLSLGNDDPTKSITIGLVVIPVINKLLWTELTTED